MYNTSIYIQLTTLAISKFYDAPVTRK